MHCSRSETLIANTSPLTLPLLSLLTPSTLPSTPSTLTSQLLCGDAGELEGFVALRQGATQVVVWVEQACPHMVEWHLLPARAHTNTYTQSLNRPWKCVCVSARKLQVCCRFVCQSLHVHSHSKEPFLETQSPGEGTLLHSANAHFWEK